MRRAPARAAYRPNREGIQLHIIPLEVCRRVEGVYTGMGVRVEEAVRHMRMNVKC